MIKYLDYFVPDGRISTEKIFSEAQKKNAMPASFSTVDEGVAFFKEVIELDEVAYTDSTTEDQMLDHLLDRFFNRKIISKDKVDLVVLIGDDLSRSNRILNLGQYILHSHNLANADVLSLSGNHCANTEFAVHYCESLMKSGNFNNVIILAVNKLANLEDRIVGTYAVHGDGAGLVYLNNYSGNGIDVLGKHAYTNGKLYDIEFETSGALLLCKNYLQCITGALTKFQIGSELFKHVIIQNANPFLSAQCLTSSGFEEEQLFKENINKYGHLDCVDFIVNLKSIVDLKPNLATKIFSFGTGSAGSNICLSLEIK